jgi:NADH:ubiquinone oxidoreductase subunit E
MDAITVTVCAGTACVVMDGSRLLLLQECLPPDLRGRVRVRGARCLDYCHGAGAARGPHVRVGEEHLEGATLEALAARIQALLAEAG